MDCLRSSLLAVGLMSAMMGCSPQRMLLLAPSTTSPSTPPVETVSRKPDTSEETKETKRTPKASTCVAVGQMRENDMDSPERTVAQREVLADHARKSYQQAIRLDPKYVPAYHALARLHVKLHQPEQALEIYRKAQKLAPEDASLCFELGMCHSRLRQWEPALESFRKACELAPDNRPYAQTYGYALARGGRFEESFEVFEKLVGPAQAHYNLARMLVHLEDHPRARHHLKQAIHLDVQLVEAQDLLVQLDGGKAAVTAPDVQPSQEESAMRTPGRLTIAEDDLRSAPRK